MNYGIRLLELLEELTELKTERANTPFKEDAWDALEAINSRIDEIVSEYDGLVRGLLDTIPDITAANNCPACTEDWDDHDGDCPVFIGRKVVDRG